MDSTPTKHCRHCGRDLPATLENFAPNKDGKFGLHSKCRDCSRTACAEWHLQNRDKANAKTRTRHHATRERQLERARTYYQANRQARREAGRAWKQANPEKIRQYNHARRAASAQVGGSFDAEDIARQLESQNGKCYWCGCKLDTYHVDHIIALSKGGSNGPENLCCACPDCNLSKHNKMPWEFAGRLF